MTPRTEAALLIAVLWLAAPALASPPVLLTGQVRALESENIYVPPSSNSPIALRYLAPEGESVAPGDVLIRIDPGDALSRIESLLSQIEQERARGDKEIAELAVREIEAELALVDAEAALAIAAIDAEIPRTFLAAIDFDRFQAEKARTTREHALKIREHREAREAVVRREQTQRLAILQIEADLRFARAQVATAEARASRSGIVLYGFDPLTGQRYQEGASAYPGNVVGMVVGGGAMAVRAWALEPDRAAIRPGQAVRVRLDALPDAVIAGRIESISGAPEAKAEWGDGRYFTVDVALSPDHALELLPGMSAQIEPLQQEDE